MRGGGGSTCGHRAPSRHGIGSAGFATLESVRGGPREPAPSIPGAAPPSLPRQDFWWQGP